MPSSTPAPNRLQGPGNASIRPANQQKQNEIGSNWLRLAELPRKHPRASTPALSATCPRGLAKQQIPPMHSESIRFHPFSSVASLALMPLHNAPKSWYHGLAVGLARRRNTPAGRSVKHT